MALEVTDKMLNVMTLALRPRTRLLTLEGTVRSSKTVTAILAFFYKVYNSHDELHCMAAYSLDSVRDNLLHNEFGLLKLFPEHCRLRREQIGGSYIELRGRFGTRKVLLVGYANVTKWKCILGKTISTFLIDEVNTADETFLKEAFSRQLSCNEPLQIWTLNGDEPTHHIYKNYINFSKIVGRAPLSIRADMDKMDKRSDYIYTHWTFYDNPVMTPEKIEAAEKCYPAGSYYHTIKILGERGTPGDLIYHEYMKPEELLVKSSDMRFTQYTIGVDIGAGRAHNVFALLGWTYDCRECVILDVEHFRQVGYDVKTQRLQAFINKHSDKHIKYVFVDSAERNYIHDLRGKITGAPIASWEKMAIKRRIDMAIVGFARHRLLFDYKCLEAFEAFQYARWAEGKKGLEREDKNELRNDIMDAVEYGMQMFMNAFLSHQEVREVEKPITNTYRVIERKAVS